MVDELGVDSCDLAINESSLVVSDNGQRHAVLCAVIEAPTPVVGDDNGLNGRNRGGRRADRCVGIGVVDAELGGQEVDVRGR